MKRDGTDRTAFTRGSPGTVMSGPDVPHNRAALVLGGVMLLALAAGIGSTWIADGDGTCRALYRPNLERTGCARKLAPAALTSAALLGGAVLSWDAARRLGRPTRVVVVAAALGVTAVAVALLLMIAFDRPGAGGPLPGTPVATVPPALAPTTPTPGGFTPPTVPRR